MDTNLANPPHIADYVRPVWQRKWLVLFVIVLATGATYARAARQHKLYEAGTLVFYQPGGDALNPGQASPSDRAVQDVAALLYARDVAVRVARRIHFPGSPEQLLADVTISARAGQDFVAISGNAGDPQLAAAIANGYAQDLVTLTNTDQQKRTAKEITGIRQQLGRRGARAIDSASRQGLNAQLGRLEVALPIPTGTRQVSPATPPSAPASPRPVRDAIFAFILSIALAVFMAFGLERFDRRLKQPDDLERAYGLPLLAVLPHSADPAPRWDDAVGIDPGFHEAFGLLRTNVQLLTLDSPPRSIVVVSAIPGEGKSTVVRNLAISMCESGKRVVLVEADLRRPMQSVLFGIPPGPGLTEVLTGAASLGDVLHDVPVRARGIDTLTRISGGDPPDTSPNGHASESVDAAITVLLAGAHPANPATVLESDRVLEVLDDLSASYDVVILDSAPLLSVTDSVPLIRYADAALIVGRLSLTTRDSVRRMTRFLDRVSEARPLGVIANDLTQLEAGGYGYGYDYGGYGGREAGPPRPKTRRGRRAKVTEHA